MTYIFLLILSRDLYPNYISKDDRMKKCKMLRRKESK